MAQFGAALLRHSRKTLSAALFSALFGLATNTAQAVPLTDLLDSDPAATITAGSFLFSDWRLIANDAETDLSQIDVTAVTDSAFGPGLKFEDTGNVLLAEMPIIDPPALAQTTSDFFDITFQYTVTLLDLSQELVAASLELLEFAIDGTGNVDIDETVQRTEPFPRPVAGLNVFAIGIPIPVEMELLDSESFEAQRRVIVTTNIFGVVEGPGDLARIDSFEQLFATIPEPASLGLFSAGLVGLAALGRFGRRRRDGAAGS